MDRIALAISFAHPVMLAAAVLAVLPIIIHLLMRTKPRLIVFPAMRFIRQTHQASITRHRVKHLVLLAMRMAAVGLLAFVLARPMTESVGQLSRDEPVAAVIILDTSGSMAYRVNSRTRLEQARELAISLVNGLPKDSTCALLWPDRPGSDLPLSSPAFVADQLRQLGPRKPGEQDISVIAQLSTWRTGQRCNVPALLRRAYKALESAGQGRREIYVLNDRTADSWAGLGEDAFVDRVGVSVYLLDVGAAGNADFMIAATDWAAQVVSPRRHPVLAVTVQSGELVGRRRLKLDLDFAGGPRQVLADETIEFKDKAVAHAARLPLPPLPPGLHLGRVWLDNADEIVEDNVRYVALEVGPPPQVMLVESPTLGSVGGGLSVGRYVEAVLAPPQAVAAGHALADLVKVAAADFMLKPSADKEQLGRSHAVILADVSVLADGQWEALRNYVAEGGTLIVLLGPRTEPRSLAGSAAAGVLPLSGTASVVRDEAGAVAAPPDFESAPLLANFRRNVEKSRIDRERITRYVSFPKATPAANTSVLLASAGERSAPLLLERRVGRGRTLLLTTCPRPDWSQWSQMSPTWVGLMHAMVTTWQRGTQRAYHLALDESAGFSPPPQFRGGVVEVAQPDGSQFKGQVNARTGTANLPTGQIGHYRGQVLASDGSRLDFAYAVNFEADEYRLARIDPRELAYAFPLRRFQHAQDAASLVRGQAEARASRSEEIGTLVGLALLLLMIVESFFSNRFYRRASPISLPPTTREGAENTLRR